MVRRSRRVPALLAGAAGVATLAATLLVPTVPRGVAAQATEAVAPRLTPPTVALNLPYVDDGDPAHRLDLFVPGGYTSPRPLVVFIHGGSWTHGSKAVLGGGTAQRTDAFRDMLLSNGYAVASVEYRFSQVARFPAQLHDVKAAVRFLRAGAAEFHIDPARIASAGESAGGHLAQLLAYTGDSRGPQIEGTLGRTGVSSAVSGVISFYGVSDLSRVVPDRLASGCARGEDGATSPEGKLIGGDPEAPGMAAEARRAAPISYVGVTSPPSLLFHGTRDCLVPARQTARLYRMLRGFGVRAQYVSVDAPHGGPLFHTDPRLARTALRFLGDTLGASGTARPPRG